MASYSSSRIEVFDVLPSTQTLAVERLRSGVVGSGWIQARMQTDGIGRRGRAWLGFSGNLMASWYGLLRLDVGHVTQLSFVAALAVTDLLRPLVRDKGDLAIKWPNDILYKNQKLCGILVQSEPTEVEGYLGIVVGIGLNVAAAPELEAYATAALKHVVLTPEDFDPLLLLEDLSVYFDQRLKLWQEAGFGHVAQDWLEQAYGRDHLIEAEDASGPITGKLQGLDQYGALKIMGASGVVHHFSGGEIAYKAI
ncbi:biotin--[acetyl-CoA-carboxylase] ligase [Asticcacaulis sp. ZE23SCel15]|uniref:biotin--[acetyl-CoA-carboxylase] ligase n=1 Tax=Asticcacaulis sp. ZE23SCel15 TaxID=3059027 RepID=UPI00265DE299|nr:biotin--[acetyl-CoA-carboxylase] ligase [Asticcacaulis sp. ZE23SCel15]WKL56602.1 biotin--[acetyl-CoA-carboxylase] ligase [Asticcacaulis sp. ZE23SCel15]